MIRQQIDLTVEWLQQKVSQAGCNGLIVGLSGGIDSSLCAFLIKEAFPNHSLGIIMPCESNSQDRIDGLKVVESCKIDYLEIDLTQNYKSLLANIEQKLLTKEKSALNLSLARANLKARLRMSTLYSVANSLNYLVVGTDNKAELYTGYFTKYGDGGVDILPVATLTKREVRQWADVMGVPIDIITKAPSAGLWANQTDEEEMGTSYDMIDDFLEGKEIPEKDRLIIERLHRSSMHKREMPPIPPKF